MLEVGVNSQETAKGTFISMSSCPFWHCLHSVQHVHFEAILFAMAAINQNEAGHTVQRASTLMVTGGTGSE